METRPRPGKYRIVAELGHGGMADVYLAVLRRTMGFSKLQVVKLLRADLADQPDFRTMFLEEARLAARLNHPAIVQTLDVGEDAGRYYMAMEYLEGQGLDRLQRRAAKTGGIPETLHLSILCDVLRALHHAHELTDESGMPLSIVHRDVSPHNVIVTYDGQVKLLDFGIAKAADSVLQTRTGVLKGKLTYMAPEQARSEPVDRRADIFSVGVMVWEAATQSRFWEGLSELQVLHRLATFDFRERLGASRPMNAKLRAIVEKALGPRDARYGTAAEMEADLARYVGTETPARERGAYVTKMFEKERASVRAKVDLQLRAMKASDSESSVPALLLTGSLAPSGSPSGPTSDPGSDPASDPRPTLRLDVPEETEEPPPASTMEALEPPLDAAPFETSTSVTLGGRPTSTELATPRGWRVPTLIAVNVVLTVAVAWVVTREPGGGTSTPTTSASIVAAPGSASAVPVSVRALPSEARLFIDDVPAPNPFSSAMPADRSVHRVRAEADGHAPRADAFVLDGRPVTVELSLEPLAAGPAGAGATRKDKGAMTLPVASAPPASSGKAPKGNLSLDKDDPWAK